MYLNSKYDVAAPNHYETEFRNDEKRVYEQSEREKRESNR